MLNILDQEDCLSNSPENLEYSERYEKMEATVEKLESAVNSIGEARDFIESAVE